MRGGGGHGHGPVKTKAEMPFFKLLGKTIPYIWTRNNWFLKLTFLCSLVFLIAGSLGDLVVPVTLKYAIDDMSPPDPHFPLWPILLYGMASFMATFFDQLRDIFFAYVSANTERLVALETFEHLQSLSLQFHLKRETGSVLRSVSRGASSFAGLLRIVLFQIVPVFFQVAVVCIFLFLKYKWYYGAVTAGVIILYFVFTFSTTDWRDKYRRVMNEKDNEFNQKATDALLNFETVKYFNAELHEEERYDKALREYSHANIRSQQTLAVLNSGQQIIIVAGVVGVMILAANQVDKDQLSIGDFVMLYQFILTLYQPLGFLGTYYRMIKQSMVDVESMVLLWQEKPDIKDAPEARELILYHPAPEIKFTDVCFSYANKVPILRNISFTVKPGSKIAIVGASGAGKSTLARLLYRFYDVSSGSISVDGQDIKSVTQNSLRQEIAIVPQDCVLFNDTIGYNIGYGAYAKVKTGATQAMIEDAAHAAQLDAFIQRQPKTYDTKVGEKQRVAIARAILKKPGIIVYDEATSSLDTHTEAAIQSAIQAVAQGRTTITVAHRLSTIMYSDSILVLDKGEIVEQGTHEALLALRGLYAQMWARQQKTLELQANLHKLSEEEKAHAATQKAVEQALAAVPGSISDGSSVKISVRDDTAAPLASAHKHDSALSDAPRPAAAAAAPTVSPVSDYASALAAARAASPTPASASAASSNQSAPRASSPTPASPTSPDETPASPSALRAYRKQMKAAHKKQMQDKNKEADQEASLHESLLGNAPPSVGSGGVN